MHKSVVVLFAACLVWAGLIGSKIDTGTRSLTSSGLSLSEGGTRIGVGIAVLVLVWMLGLFIVRGFKAAFPRR